MTNEGKLQEHTIFTDGRPGGVNGAMKFVATVAAAYGDRLEKVEVTSGKVTFMVRDDDPVDEYRVWGNVPPIEPQGEAITVAVAQLKQAVKHAVNAGGGATWEELNNLSPAQVIELLRYSEREANNAANILRALLGEVYFGDNHDES